MAAEIHWNATESVDEHIAEAKAYVWEIHPQPTEAWLDRLFARISFSFREWRGVVYF